MWHSFSVIDKLAEQHFFNPIVNTVHAAYLFHLVGSFQVLGNAFGCFHLRNQQIQAFLAGIVNAVQMLHELTGQQELIEQEGTMLPEIAQAVADEDILYAGKYSSPDIELLMSEGCDLAIENMMIYHSPKTAEQIEKCGIPVLIERSSAESHPLGRLEWIRLYGLILGKQDEAERFFSEKCALLDDVVSRDSTGSTAAFFYISSNGYAVVRKPGDYISKMIELAGGEYVFTADDLKVDENALSSANIQFEAFYALAKDADCVIYNGTVDGGVDSLAQLSAKNPLLADFRAFQTGNVWCTNATVFQKTSAAAEMTEELHRIFSGGDGDFDFFCKLT